jgi:hypothetical protein
MNAGSDNHVLMFAVRKHYGLVDVSQGGLEWNAPVGRGEITELHHIHPPWGFLLWPHYSMLHQDISGNISNFYFIKLLHTTQKYLFTT